MLRLNRFALPRILAQNARHKSSKEKQTPAAATDKASDIGAAGDDKLAARRPLVKNFFMGIVDKELLGYPEVLSREDMSKIQNELLPLKNFFAEEIDAAGIDGTRNIPQNLLQQIKDLGLYSLTVPVQHEGRGYNWTQSVMMAEPETKCTDIALELLSHRSVVDIIKEVGTLDQQERFLKRLANGK